MSTNTVEIIVSSKDRTGSGFGSAERGASRLGAAFGRVRDVAGKAGHGIGRVGQVAGKTGSGFGSLVGGIGKAGAGLAGIAGIAGGAALGLGTAAIAVGQRVIGLAGNLELMEKKAKTVFGSQIGRVQTWASANAHAMGLTRRETVGLAASMADLLIPMGFTRQAAADMATKTIGLSGALAEWSNGQVTAAGAADILQAAFLGERDGLQALGISVSQAEVDAKLLAKGQKDLTGAALQQAEALATQELIFAKSTDAQNAFAAGSGSLARKSAETSARLKEMGQNLLVAVTPALHKVAGTVNKEVMPRLERFTTWLAGPGKFKVADAFLGWAQGSLGMAKVTLPVLRTIASMFLTTVGVLVTGAARAFGWVPDVGPKLRAAAASFGTFKDSALRGFDGAIRKVGQWDTAVGRARKMVALQANISDLNTKLASAREQLNNPNLTKARRAQIQANIAQLEDALGRARADIARVRGKTVYIDAVYRNGVNITRPSSVGRRQHGGDVQAGRPYIVGERQAELFVPDQNGTILPSVPTGRSSRGGGSPIVIHFNLGGGSNYTRALLEDLRKAIRIEGGNVQAVLGP